MQRYQLDNRTLIKALEMYKASIPQVEVFQHAHIDEQIEVLKKPAEALGMIKDGGAHLGRIREWLKSKAINGERVTWGSTDMLQFVPLSVQDMEYLAASIAASAINDFTGHNR